MYFQWKSKLAKRKSEKERKITLQLVKKTTVKICRPTTTHDYIAKEETTDWIHFPNNFSDSASVRNIGVSFI